MTQFSLPFTPFSSALDAGRCNRETKKRKRDGGPTELTSPFGHSTVTPKSNFHWDGNHRTSIRIRRYPERFVRSRPPVAPTVTPGRKLRDNYYGEFAHTSPGHSATLLFSPLSNPRTLFLVLASRCYHAFPLHSCSVYYFSYFVATKFSARENTR